MNAELLRTIVGGMRHQLIGMDSVLEGLSEYGELERRDDEQMQEARLDLQRGCDRLEGVLVNWQLEKRKRKAVRR